MATVYSSRVIKDIAAGIAFLAFVLFVAPFIVVPSVEDRWLWVVTVVSLGVLGAAAVYFRKRKRQG